MAGSGGNVGGATDELSSRDREDTDRIPPGGTPGYELFVVRTGWQISERIALSAAVENIGDVDYRVHGSGLNGAGRTWLSPSTEL